VSRTGLREKFTSYEKSYMHSSRATFVLISHRYIAFFYRINLQMSMMRKLAPSEIRNAVVVMMFDERDISSEY